MIAAAAVGGLVVGTYIYHNSLNFINVRRSQQIRTHELDFQTSIEEDQSLQM